MSSLLSVLIRHLLCILCYIGIIQYYCYILLFYCYIVLCVYITHCTHIFNHCNDLALNGSLIGNKHICIYISIFNIKQKQISWFFYFRPPVLQHVYSINKIKVIKFIDKTPKLWWGTDVFVCYKLNLLHKFKFVLTNV